MVDPQLKEPILRRTLEQPYPCHSYPSLFYTSSELEAHQSRSHARERNKEILPGWPNMAERSDQLNKPFPCNDSDLTCPSALRCPLCCHQFTAQARLDKHLRGHAQDSAYRCETCNCAFVDILSLNTHRVFNHDGEKPFQCSACGKGFSRYRYLSVHMLLHSGEKRFACSTCGQGFHSRKSLRAHAQAHIEDGNRVASLGLEKPFQCSTCGKIFTNKYLLQGHSLINHGVEDPLGTSILSEDVKPIISKDVKPIISKDVKPIISKDVKPIISEDGKVLHSGEKRFGCSTCGQGFQSWKALRTHGLAHIDGPETEDGNLGVSQALDEPCEFECTTCGKIFSNQYLLHGHSLINHGGEEPLRTSILSENVKPNISEDDVKPNISEEVKPDITSNYNDPKPEMSCVDVNPIFGSDFDYVKRNIRRRSSSIRTRHRCPLCCHEFGVQASLKKHLRGHCQDSDYRCEACNCAFTNQHILNMHIGYNHSSTILGL